MAIESAATAALMKLTGVDSSSCTSCTCTCTDYSRVLDWIIVQVGNDSISQLVDIPAPIGLQSVIHLHDFIPQPTGLSHIDLQSVGREPEDGELDNGIGMLTSVLTSQFDQYVDVHTQHAQCMYAG